MVSRYFDITLPKLDWSVSQGRLPCGTLSRHDRASRNNPRTLIGMVIMSGEELGYPTQS
jgi:hypothetical protein